MCCENGDIDGTRLLAGLASTPHTLDATFSHTNHLQGASTIESMFSVDLLNTTSRIAHMNSGRLAHQEVMPSECNHELLNTNEVSYPDITRNDTLEHRVESKTPTCHGDPARVYSPIVSESSVQVESDPEFTSKAAVCLYLCSAHNLLDNYSDTLVQIRCVFDNDNTLYSG